MNWHDNQRGWFARELYTHMKGNNKIWLVVGDLGYGMFEKHREDFPDRFLNVGAAEQSMLDIAVGLSLEGKIPFVYSIASFLLYRGFETIRNYINRERLNVKLVGAGRDKDYLEDGFSHWADEDRRVMRLFPNVQCAWPETKELLPEIVNRMVKYNKPYYLNLRRNT